jgi:hypothetical protein
MELLRKYIKGILSEAAFESGATAISRVIVAKLVSCINARKEHGGPIFGSPAWPRDEINFTTWRGEEDLPPDAIKAGISRIVIKLNVLAPQKSGARFLMSGMTHYHGYGTSSIIINISAINDFPIQSVSNLVRILKNMLVHELTHGNQSDQSHDVTLANNDLYGDDDGRTMTSLRAYFLDPGEVEAHARGAYKNAKMSKKPLSNIIDDEVERNIKTYSDKKRLQGADYSEEDLVGLFDNEYREAIYSYARKYLPAAQI